MGIRCGFSQDEQLKKWRCHLVCSFVRPSIPIFLEANLDVVMFLVFHQCFASVSHVVHQCFTIVSPLFHHCFTIVSPLFHQCFITINKFVYRCVISKFSIFFKVFKVTDKTNFQFWWLLPSSVPVNPISIDWTEIALILIISTPAPRIVRREGPRSLKLCKHIQFKVI